MCLTGVYSNHRLTTIPADAIGLRMVLRHEAVFGPVNANRHHFENSLKDVATAEKHCPRHLRRFITRVVPLEGFREGQRRGPEDVKTRVRLAQT